MILVAIAIFVVLSNHTLTNLASRPAWDDIGAWLTLKFFAKSLYQEGPADSFSTKKFYVDHLHCNDGFSLYRKRKTYAGLLEEGCPIEGVLVAGPGLYQGHRLDKFIIDVLYPVDKSMQVLLYPVINSSLFLLNSDDARQTLFSGIKFAIFDPLVVTYQPDELTPDIKLIAPIPFHNYIIARWSQPTDEYVILRKQSHYFVMEQPPQLRIDLDDDKPWKWEQSRILLAKAGIEPNPSKLSLGDPAVLRALAAAYADPSEVEFIGFPLPARLFLQWFSIILLALGVGCSSAIRRLEKVTNSTYESAWVFASPRAGGVLGIATEVMLVTISLAIALAPLAGC